MTYYVSVSSTVSYPIHDYVIKWKHFPRYWPFVRGIHRSPVNSPHKGQWHGALMFSLICAWINGWINNREAGDLRRQRAHYDITVMLIKVKGNERLCIIRWLQAPVFAMRFSIASALTQWEGMIYIISLRDCTLNYLVPIFPISNVIHRLIKLYHIL